jgi:CRP/FNR family transcriptional regulator, anaerobic regulatory protein
MLATVQATATRPNPKAVRTLPTCPATSNALGDAMAEGVVHTYEGKEHIFREGDRAKQVYMLEVGHVCIYKMLSDGRRQVIDFAYPGDVIGLATLSEHISNAQAMTRSRIRCVPMAALQQVAREDARLGFQLYEAVSRELRAARELLFTVSQRTATERVAAFLLALSRRNEIKGDDPLEYVLPMTRNDIADYLGLTIETVSRTFTKLRSEGMIEVSQSVLVTIADFGALVHQADTKSH